MSWSKGSLVSQAYNELALSGWIFDISPEELLHGLTRMEGMWGSWDGQGIRAGYAFASDAPTSADLKADSGLLTFALRPTYLNLAIELAAGFGKQLLPSTMKAAADSFDVLLWTAAFPAEQQLPDRMPRGAGNKPWRINDWPFYPKPDTSPLENTTGGDLQIDE